MKTKILSALIPMAVAASTTACQSDKNFLKGGKAQGDLSTHEEGSSDQQEAFGDCPVEDNGYNFTLTGSKWGNTHLSASFMPDGTSTSSQRSGLFTLLDAAAPRAVWQREYARAMARWAAVTPLNIRFVPDNGAAGGTTGIAQSDNRFGDVRLGARDLGTTYLGMTAFPSNSGTGGGDLFFNTRKNYNTSAGLWVFTVALHEFGHAIGLNHSTIGNAMYSSIYQILSGLTQDDINGAQAIYGPRLPDAYDKAASNDSLETAAAVTMNPGVNFIDGDLTTAADVDHYVISIPAGAEPVLSVTTLGGQSLLTAKIQVLDMSGALLGEASAADYGQGALVQVEGVSPGGQYVIAVDSPVEDEFGSGAYRLAVETRATRDDVAYAAPAALAPDARESNDSLGTASSLGQTSSQTVSSLNLHWTWDEDYFAFVAAKGSRTYEVSVAGSSSPLQVEIFNSTGQKIAQTNGAASVRFAVSPSETYRIRIFSSTQAQIGYSLTVKKI